MTCGATASTTHVADSLFTQVAGKGCESISLAALSDYLVQHLSDLGIPLTKVQELFNKLDVDGNGMVDRQEWRAGFTAGLVPH